MFALQMKDSLLFITPWISIAAVKLSMNVIIVYCLSFHVNTFHVALIFDIYLSCHCLAGVAEGLMIVSLHM